MKTLAIIDADSLVFEAALSEEYECHWGDDLWTLHSDLGPAREHFDGMVDAIRERLGADEIVMALSDYEDPWRKIIMPTYKENRKKLRKPLVFKPLREHVHASYSTFQRLGLEGDDIIGILLTSTKLFPGTRKIAVSIDKDMNTLPGEHYKIHKDIQFSLTEDEADLYHITQTLTGDATDGYPGCPGVGPVSAAKLLEGQPREKWWSIVLAAYQKKGLGSEVALQNAQVARILRVGDYDFVNKKVIPWLPKV